MQGLSNLLRLIGGLGYFLLITRFVLMIFYPGTPETANLFSALQGTMPLFKVTTDLLMSPMDFIIGLMHPLFPPNLQDWFPTSNAATFMDHVAKLLTRIPALSYLPAIQQLSQTNYAQHYPGEIQWTALLTIPMLSTLLTCLDFLGFYIMENLETQATKKPTHTASTSSSWASSGSQATYPGTQNRTQDPAIREMLNSLKRENMELQVQKQELRSTFSQYISPKVVKYLEQNRQAFQGIANQKQQVTILFCDIRGFTSFSQSHTPEEIAQFLGSYYSIVNDIIINRFDGTINKLMGDGLMAYWGFPIPTAEHPMIATQAGLAILKALDERNAQAEQAIQIGIGICSGEVVVGNIGSKDFMDFTLIGDPVNLASRIEGINKILQTRILITETTYRGLRGKIRCKSHGPQDIRGWQGQLQVFEPTL
jgi:adenylate cyclase